MSDIDDLRKRIDDSTKSSTRCRGDDERTEDAQSMSFASLTFRYATEFVAAVMVGLAIGFFTDHYFGTAPWGLLIWLALGMVAGILSIVRAYRELTESIESGKSTSTSSDKHENSQTKY